MLLRVQDIAAGYGDSQLLSGISFSLAPGQSLALLGRNGVGKTTLLKTLLGLTRLHVGRIYLGNTDVSRWSPERRASAGIGWVPQERGIFCSLTVLENLTAVARPGPWTPERVFNLFPRLADYRRRGGDELSGGEQQMLAIGRALVLNPRVLLLDEPMEGLAPVIAQDVQCALTHLFREEGIAGIVVEQHARKALGMTDQAIILERGHLVYQAASADLLADTTTRSRFLGVG
ncbi:MAG: ABC transporter ATP-binding protein [Elstera sp.]